MGILLTLWLHQGLLESIDGFLSVVLRDAHEFIGGKLHKVYGDVFIRSNNGEHNFDVLGPAPAPCGAECRTNSSSALYSAFIALQLLVWFI